MLIKSPLNPLFGKPSRSNSPNSLYTAFSSLFKHFYNFFLGLSKHANTFYKIWAAKPFVAFQQHAGAVLK